MELIKVIVIMVIIIFFICSIITINYHTDELKYLDYIYYAKVMFIDAIHEYNTQCIENDEQSFVDYKDVMDYLTACDMYPKPIGWRDLISKDKLELLKPYLPDDPDKYIYDKVKGGEA